MTRRLFPVTVVAALLCGGLLATSASAQIFVSAGSPYTQNFDSLANTGTANTWADNTTLPGWYASKTAGGATVATYRADTGAANTGAIYSYGATSATDRALGSVASGTPGNFAYGVLFHNDTAQAMTNITISYTGEQWRNGGNTATQTLAFSYFVSSAPISGSDAANANAWIPFPSLSFNSPTVGATAAALDGTADANRQIFSGVLLANVVVFPGQEIFFRWYDINDTGNDHGLAVEDLNIAFTLVTAVTNPPAIDPSGQPQSRTNNAGTKATFTVTATGSALSYQWQYNEVNIDNSVKVGGASTPTLTVSPVLDIDQGSYRVIVSNGSGSVTSLVAVLTVVDPAVNTQPASRTNVFGDTANFFVGAAGTIPLSYQWRLNGTDLDGGTASSLNMLATNQGSYSVVVGNVNGNYTTSAVATLTLLSTPANTLARWDFNDTNNLVVTAPTPSTGTGSAALLNGATASFTSGTFSDPAATPGAANSGWNTASYPPQGTSNKTAGVQFNVSTLGYQDLLLTWEERHSDTASKYARLQYTADGNTFTDGDLITMTSTNNGWVFYVSNLSGVSAVNNNPNFAFRIVSEWEATAISNNNSNYAGTVSSYSTGGTMRFDLMSVYGNVFSPPTLVSTTISNIIGTTLTYGGGKGAQFVLLKSTNPAASLTGWTRVHTNFATPGTFSVPAGSEKAGFYRIKSE